MQNPDHTETQHNLKMDHPDDVWVRMRSLLDIQFGLEVPTDDPFFVCRQDRSERFDDDERAYKDWPEALTVARKAQTTRNEVQLADGRKVHFEANAATVTDADGRTVHSWPCGKVSVFKTSHFAQVGNTLWVVEVMDPDYEFGYEWITFLCGYDLTTGQKEGPICRWACDFVYQADTDTFFVHRAQPRRVADHTFAVDDVIVDRDGHFLYRPRYRREHIESAFDTDGDDEC